MINFFSISWYNFKNFIISQFKQCIIVAILGYYIYIFMLFDKLFKISYWYLRGIKAIFPSESTKYIYKFLSSLNTFLFTPFVTFGSFMIFVFSLFFCFVLSLLSLFRPPPQFVHNKRASRNIRKRKRKPERLCVIGS